MRKIILIFCTILLISFAAAEVIITEQPGGLYSLGDTIKIPLKIITLTDINELFTINLICNGVQTEVYKEYISISAGEEIERNPAIPLIQSFIGKPTGTCVIKVTLGSEAPQLTSEFEISDLIIIELKTEKSEFVPEESIVIEGDVKKENKEPVQGIVELKVTGNNATIVEKIDTIRNGYFYLNFSMPAGSKAAAYLVRIDTYEIDLSGQKTNKGFINHEITITQVPTNLEIILENSEVEPGTNLQVKTVLHDQTGESIESTSIITIKNEKDEILEQTEKSTNEFLEFPVAYNEPPAEWKLVAVSNKLTAETTFNITAKADIGIVLINKTVIIANTGNIEYCNKTVLIKIGEEEKHIDVCLSVDESQEYILTAPDGEYEIEIISEDEETITRSVMLTGKTIEVKEASKGIGKLIRFPFVWIFIIAILGFITFMFIKKGYKKSFFGYIRRRKEKSRAVPLRKSSLVNTRNKAELSLSIKGDKQNVSLVCLKIKNLDDIESKKGNAKETLQKIVDFAEEKKAATYENQDNLFFILAPTKTKTFSNEKTAVGIGQKIKEVLTEHNRLFKQKIEFGVGLNYGTIIAKQEKDAMKFMSMGTLIATAKKTSSLANNDVLIGEKMNDKLKADVKTEKQTHGKTTVYTIKEIKNREEHKKFLSSFMKRMEKEKVEKKQ